MKVLVLSCSPKKELSITYQTEQFLEKMFPQNSFEVEFTGDGKITPEIAEKFEKADLTMILSSVYHFSVHSQMISLFRDMEQKLSLEGKMLTYMTTSCRILEINAHEYVRRWAERKNMHFIQGISLRDSDILEDSGKEELGCWFNFVSETVECIKTKNIPKAHDNSRVVIVDTSDEESAINTEMSEHLRRLYSETGANAEIIRLRDYNIMPCIGCNTCYSNRTCIYKDDFESVINNIFLNTDIVVMVGTLKYDIFGLRYKMYCDRQVQFGRSGLDMETILLFAYSTTEETAPDALICFRMHEEALASYNGYVQAGYVCGAAPDMSEETAIANLSEAVNRSVIMLRTNLLPQKNFWYDALCRQFADTTAPIRASTKADYEWFDDRHFYQFAPPHPMIKPVNNYEDSQTMRSNRVIPYVMQRNHYSGGIPVSPRRMYKNVKVSDRLRSKTEKKEQ